MLTLALIIGALIIAAYVIIALRSNADPTARFGEDEHALWPGADQANHGSVK